MGDSNHKPNSERLPQSLGVAQSFYQIVKLLILAIAFVGALFLGLVFYLGYHLGNDGRHNPSPSGNYAPYNGSRPIESVPRPYGRRTV